MYIIWQNCKFI